MIGQKLGGRFELLARVGGGGMAVVYKAQDLLLHRVVAVKVLRPQFAIDDDFVHRFRREAQSAARLSHPNIVNIYDVGEDDDIHYIVMEYVEGSTLKEYITNYAPIPVREAIEITKQIAEALDHAHQNHIIHRDIKPHNILIGKNMRIKVTDFGIARAVTSSTITHTGSVLGSVHYFSPEQARGGHTGEKSDIYSLGIVLYEMLTGKLPYSGESPISVALKHLQESYIEPRQLNPSIPQSVENMILRSLAKDPIHRYASARELIGELDRCLDHDRTNDKKINLTQFNDEEDEEATKIIPVLSEDLYETKVITPPNVEEEDEDWEEEEDRPKRSIWVKLGIICAIFAFLIVGAILGIKLLTSLLYVEEIAIADVTDRPLEEALKTLKDQGLHVNQPYLEQFSEDIAEGRVMEQDPAADAPVKKNTYVTLTISKGQEKEKMPGLLSLAEQAARRLLTDYKEIKVVPEFNEEVPSGQVIRQEPQENALVVPAETVVTLYISKGAEKIAMPNLIGKEKEEAEAILLRERLILDEPIEEDFAEMEVGKVFRQAPFKEGELVEANTRIKIWISKGPQETVRERTVEIPVQVEEDEVVHVSIFITDEDGDRQIINENIDQRKTYHFPVKVSRDHEAVVKVFINGELHERKIVTFE